MGDLTKDKISRIFDQAKNEALVLLLDSAKTAETPRAALLPPKEVNQDAQRLKEELQRMMAKRFITVKEASILLSCSEGHIRNLVERARKGKAVCPIPFRDLGGVTTFDLDELLKWTERPKKTEADSGDMHVLERVGA